MLTTGGLLVLILLFIFLLGNVGRVGILIVLIIGAALPFAHQLGDGAVKLSSAVAPLLNALGGGGLG